MFRPVLLGCFLMSACLQSGVTVCAGDRICPGATVCDDVHGLCVTPAQLTACEGLDEMAACPLDETRDGECRQGVCIEQACGDGLVTGTEDCDGEAEINSCTKLGFYDDVPLPCSKRCAFDPGVCTGRCGDGMLNGEEGDEVCDGAPPTGASCLEYGFEAGRLGCNEFCAPGFAACHDIGFVPFVATSGENILSVHVPEPGTVVMVEREAVVISTEDSVRRDPLPLELRAAWGSSASNVVVVGSNSRAFRFDGSAWTTTTLPGSRELYGVWGSGPNDVYAVGGNLSIYRFDGVQWQELTSEGVFTSFFAVWGTSAQDVIAVGGSGNVRRYNGAAWSPMDASACWGVSSPPTFRGVWSSGPSDVFVVGSGGMVCHFDGQQWVRHSLGVATELTGVWGRGPDDVYVVGLTGTIFHYNGSTWWRLDSETNKTLLGISGLGDEVVVSGEVGYVRRVGAAVRAVPSTPTDITGVGIGSPEDMYIFSPTRVYRRVGVAWEEELANSTDEFYSMWVAPSGVAFAVEGNVVHRSTGNGVWSPTTLSFSAIALTGRSATDAYAVGQVGGIAHYAGSAWSNMTSNTTAELVDVSATPTRVFAVGNTLAGSPTVVQYDGATWSSMSLPAGTPELLSIYAAADNDVFVSGDQGTILHFDGTAWSAMETSAFGRLGPIRGSSGTDVFVAGNNGALQHWDGTAWSPVAGPTGGVGQSELDVRPGFVFVATQLLSTAILRSEPW